MCPSSSSRLDLRQPLSHDFVQVRSAVTPDEFRADFVDGRVPLLLRGFVRGWPAVERWNLDRFQQIGRGKRVLTKDGYDTGARSEEWSLDEYARAVQRDEKARIAGLDRSHLPYLHDVPLFLLVPELLDDVNAFPSHLLPPWYGHEWWKFCQFFMGPAGSGTPLHFDTLYTHNLFFQVTGAKRFTMVPASQRALCYVHDWRWSDVNTESPDYERHPLFHHADRVGVTLEAGDVLYLPPGTLHAVRNETATISFNIDWHTERSVRQGLSTVLSGAPLRNLYYNALLYLGVVLRVPRRVIYPLYRSYLNYVS